MPADRLRDVLFCPEIPGTAGVLSIGAPVADPLDDPDACPHCGGRLDRDDRVRSLVEAGEAMAASMMADCAYHGNYCDVNCAFPDKPCPVARWRRVNPKPPEKP